MSRSFTVRPTNAKQQRPGMEGASPGRGVGRGRGRGAPGNQGPSYRDIGQGARPRDRTVSGGTGHQEATGQQTEGNGNAIPDERFKRGDGYTLVVPNEKKRQSVLKQGQKELEAYQKHKESRRPANFSYVGTVGGPNIPEDEVRRQQAQEDRRQKMNMRDKREQYRQTQKQQEDKQIQMKKDYYRGQAQKKEVRQKKETKEREKKWAEDHRQKNQAFLDRLEAQQKGGRPHAGVRSTAGGSHDRKEVVEEEQEEGAFEGEENPLAELRDLYPNYDIQMLSEILQSTDGDLDEAIALLKV
ncbi:epithelial-stromal interaction protein 1-like [Branchiostoma floridae]|uniref:Epithelial-stromal interaction protein 1-like n=1 Tax=Branchiostoma floridae TaxID=7739 RepID=A0A9J7N8H5_BRAFL|nr:epithelial-stromal interaction protein 1-like [Branchiostoma floridae]